MIAHNKMMLALMKAYPTEWIVFSFVVSALVITTIYYINKSQKIKDH